MAVAKRKRVTRRDWTRDEVRELKKHSKGKTRGEDRLQSPEAHARGLKTKGLCARNLAGSPQQKEVIGSDCFLNSVSQAQRDSYAKLQSPPGLNFGYPPGVWMGPILHGSANRAIISQLC